MTQALVCGCDEVLLLSYVPSGLALSCHHSMRTFIYQAVQIIGSAFSQATVTIGDR